MSDYIERVRRLDDYAKTLMDAWEKAEGTPLSVSYIATFVDMAKVVIEKVDKESAEAWEKGYDSGFEDGINHE